MSGHKLSTVMRYHIITISRQVGCYGRDIGKAVAQKLDIDYYDKELINIIACESGFCREFVEQNCEYATSSPLDYLPMTRVNMAAEGFAYQTATDHVQQVVGQVITEIAHRGPCVIVGRGADFLLRHRGDVLNVFLYGTIEERTQILLERKEVDSIERAEELIRTQDRNRKRNYKHYTDRNWGEPELYHLCLNSAILGVEQCSLLIANVFRTHVENL